jgi:hypothetical protein
MKKFILATISSLLLIGGVSLLYLYEPNQTLAANFSEFKAGNIISDYVMSNKNSMNEAQIQAFLKSKNSCNDSDRGKFDRYTASGYQYSWRDGHFVCMADESFDGESASHIIWQASQDYNINPQVLIVLLQKEQTLVTDTWPNWNHQYAAATGYDCPDSGNGCNNANAGFKTQIRKAANLFREVLNGGWSNYVVGWNTIQYNPNASCGSSSVYIENRATSALYRYTPYQPNPATLSVPMGATANCGAYGNKNFYGYFTDWFGSTTAQVSGFVSLDTPRYIQVKENGTQKRDVFSGEKIGDELLAEQQIKFVDKILVNEVWYLRSEYNRNDGGPYGIPQDELEEIPYQAIEARLLVINQNAWKSIPAAQTAAPNTNMLKGTMIKAVDQISVNGATYYRTEFDHNNGGNFGVADQFVSESLPLALDVPRNFYTNKATHKINIGDNATETISAGTILFINKKTFYDNEWYFQANSDNGTLWFVKSSDLTSGLPTSGPPSGSLVKYVSFEIPRNMRLATSAVRINPYTKEPWDTLPAGMVIHFSTKVLIDGQWHYRTTHNTQNNIDAVIPSTAISEI